MIDVKFDASAAVAAYQRAFRQLHNLPGFDPRLALTAEAGVILKTWAGRTKVTKQDQIDVRARVRALYIKGLTKGDITINAGRRGAKGVIWHRSSSRKAFAAGKRKFRVAGRLAEGGHIVANWQHFRDEDWQDINDKAIDADREISVQVKRGEKSAGLARQSVIQIADDLGIDLARVKGGGSLSAAGIAKARGAIASSGNAYKNGHGMKGGDDVKSYVELITRLPYGAKIGMDRTLAGVLQGRATYIGRTYEKGAVDSLARVSRAFPEILRLRAANPTTE